jgi:hypothetical protein
LQDDRMDNTIQVQSTLSRLWGERPHDTVNDFQHKTCKWVSIVCQDHKLYTDCNWHIWYWTKLRKVNSTYFSHFIMFMCKSNLSVVVCLVKNCWQCRLPLGFRSVDIV